MRNMIASLLVIAVALGTSVTFAQTPAPGAAPAGAVKVKAVQPGLLEVSGPRVNEVVAAGIQKITATTATGWRAIAIQSPWGDSYLGWPKNLKPVAFTITTNAPGGTATISAPGFKESNKADFKAAVEAIVTYAIARTEQNKRWVEGSQGGR
jgi:hypothetical protein